MKTSNTSVKNNLFGGYFFLQNKIKLYTILILYNTFPMQETFLSLQETFHLYNRNNRSEWLPGGESIKSAINKWLTDAYKRLINNSHYKEQNHKTVEISFVWWKSNLPEDFYIEYEVKNGDRDFYGYRINKKDRTIELVDSDIKKITLAYMPTIDSLELQDDVPGIEDHFHEVIPLYAAEHYHRSQLDWDNVARSVADAEDKMEDLISKYF